MRLTIIILMLLFNGNTLKAQSIDEIKAKRVSINKTGMLTLGSWSIANMVVSGIAYPDSKFVNRGFHEMNFMFSAINLGIAGFALYSSQKEGKQQLSFSQNLLAQQKMEIILAFNAGLDLAYITTGLHFRERGAFKENSKLEGYGQALILQGSFLFLFDSVMFFTHRKNGLKLNQFAEKITFGFNGSGAGFNIRI